MLFFVLAFVYFSVYFFLGGGGGRATFDVKGDFFAKTNGAMRSKDSVHHEVLQV